MRDTVSLGEVRFQGHDSASFGVALPEGAQGHQAIAFIVMSPFFIESPCAIRVEVETEEGVLRGGSLWIEAIDPANAASFAAQLPQQIPPVA
jgi:hypothetical protein